MDVEEADDIEESSRRPRGSDRALAVTWRLLLLAVVLAALGVTLAQSLRVYFAQAQEIAAKRAEIHATRERIGELEDQLERWRDPAFIKAEARERLGWVLPGETGYRVIGADGKPIGGDSTVLAPTRHGGGLWWEGLWGSVKVADSPVEGQEDTVPSIPMPSPSGTP